jgi:hypothetical protein
MLHRRQSKGFSFVEVLTVVGIAATALALTGGISWHLLASMQLRTTATELLETLKSARRYAIDQRCRTRVAFRPGLYSSDPAVRAANPERSYRMHVFTIPGTRRAEGPRWMPVNSPLDEGKSPTEIPWTQLHSAPRSESLVGRWLVSDSARRRHIVPDAVDVLSPMFDQFQQDGAAAFFKANYFTPDSVWIAHAWDAASPENCYSHFPKDYHLTPADDGPVVIEGVLPEDEKCWDPKTRRMVSAQSLWSGEMMYVRGFKDTDLQELPGVEFLPDGSLAAAWTREIEFRVQPEGRMHPYYLVVIDTATGLARLVEEENP